MALYGQQWLEVLQRAVWVRASVPANEKMPRQFSVLGVSVRRQNHLTRELSCARLHQFHLIALPPLIQPLASSRTDLRHQMPTFWSKQHLAIKE